MATIDINKDGIDDLAVSAPIWSEYQEEELNDKPANKVYRGKVLIYLGKQGVGIVKG